MADVIAVKPEGSEVTGGLFNPEEPLQISGIEVYQSMSER